MLPPNKPNHAGLAILPMRANNLTAMSKKMLGEAKERERPDWVPGIKELIWANMKAMRMGFEHKGTKYARCYMCLTPEPINDFEIEHVSPWNGILEKLKRDATDDKLRARYDQPADLFLHDGKEGKWIPTSWSGIYYSNDLDNLLLIHGRGCNQSKGKKDAGDAMLSNVYSQYGDLAHLVNANGYKDIVSAAPKEDRPVSYMIGKVRENANIWHLLGRMEELWNQLMDFTLHMQSQMAGLMQAVTPLPQAGERMQPMMWQDTSRKPDGTKATPNQTASMNAGNNAASVLSRPRASFDDSRIGVGSTMEQKLREIPRKALKRSMDRDAVMPDFKVGPLKQHRPAGGPPIDAPPPPPAGFIPPPAGSPLLPPKK